MIKKQGITISVLVITIIILTILAGTITVSTLSTISYSKLSSWVNEMAYIQDVVDEANNTYSNMNYLMQEIQLDTSLANSNEQFEGEEIGEDNILILKILDLGKLKITNTTYGNLETTTDVYAMSEETGKVYYVQGIDVDGQIYYSLTNDMRQRFNLTSSANALSSVVFVPNVVGYSNRPIMVVVKIPNTYTNISITTSNNEIEIGSQTEKETTYEYTVNVNQIAGNYVIKVTYNNGTDNLTSKYEVNGYDITPPIIAPIDYYNLAYKETDTEKVDYITNITATDLSGIKLMKYELGTIAENDAKSYFKDNGNVIFNGRINLDRNTTVYTVYAEDNAGNFSILTFDKKDIMPEDWKENVSYIQDRVPIPKGFVASPYEGENTKNGGMVIYELGENETSIPTDETQFESWTTRNQYVWVPVDNFSKFVRQNYTVDKSKISNTPGATEGFWEAALDTTTNIPLKEQDNNYMSDDTELEVVEMYSSVKEYGGFYIARYEAGINNERTSNNGILETNVYSMMGKTPYTYIPWSNSNAMNIDTGGAVEVARGLYTSTDQNYGVISTLVYGVQWDTVLQWWLDTGAVADVVNKGNYGNLVDVVINSSNDLNNDAKVKVYQFDGEYLIWGYKDKNSTDISYPKKASGDRWLLTTGALKVAKANNIYDMLGNVYEYTMEGYSNAQPVSRGDSFYGADSGVSRAVSYRSYRSTTDNSYGRGFRTALYIKLPT